jgi:hypothetical protein
MQERSLGDFLKSTDAETTAVFISLSKERKAVE